MAESQIDQWGRERKEGDYCRAVANGAAAPTASAVRRLKGAYPDGKSYQNHPGRGNIDCVLARPGNDRTCDSPEGVGAYTVFAPTDAAFAQMKAETRDDLFDDYYDLSKVIKYHVVMGIYKAADLLDVMFLKTMEGQRLIIRSSASEELTGEKLEDG